MQGGKVYQTFQLLLSRGGCYPQLMDGGRTQQKGGHSITPLSKQRLIWLPTLGILGVLACQHVSAVEVEQP